MPISIDGRNLNDSIPTLRLEAAETITAGDPVLIRGDGKIVVPTYGKSSEKDFGAVMTAELNRGYDGFVAATIDFRRAIVVYRYNDGTDKIWASVLTVDGETMALSTAVEVYGAAAEHVSVDVVDGTKAVCAYRNTGDGGLEVVVININGDTISSVSAALDTGEAIDSSTSRKMLDLKVCSSSLAIVAYAQTATGDIWAASIDISGATPTLISTGEVDASPSFSPALVAVDSERVVCGYSTSVTSYIRIVHAPVESPSTIVVSNSESGTAIVSGGFMVWRRTEQGDSFFFFGHDNVNLHGDGDIQILRGYGSAQRTSIDVRAQIAGTVDTDGMIKGFHVGNGMVVAVTPAGSGINDIRVLYFDEIDLPTTTTSLTESTFLLRGSALTDQDHIDCIAMAGGTKMLALYNGGTNLYGTLISVGDIRDHIDGIAVSSGTTGEDIAVATDMVSGLSGLLVGAEYWIDINHNLTPSPSEVGFFTDWSSAAIEHLMRNRKPLGRAVTPTILKLHDNNTRSVRGK